MKTTRRRFLQRTAVLMPLVAAWPLRAAETGPTFKFDPAQNIIPAPDDPAQWPAFREALAQWRTETRARLRYSDALYRRKEFAWAASNYCCRFLMVCDEMCYDRHTGRYTVAKVVEHGQQEFGGYDSVVLWHAYPRIGVDERNQFDFYRDLPGGLKGLRAAVREFHRRGVKVYLDYNPWDTGTRREGKSDLDALVAMVQSLEADGIFLDTMSKGGADFRARLDAARPGVILEGENAVPLENLHDHHASWAQWFADSHVPGVLRLKWFERRHMQHQIRRWDHDHTAELHSAWMNGSGMMVWENVFGCWVSWSPRDRSILRSMLPIQRRFTALFSGEAWTPLLPVQQPGVFASLWEGHGLRLWTLINRTSQAVSGNLLRVPPLPRHRYFDLVAGAEVHPPSDGALATLSSTLLPRGIGCFLSGPPTALGKAFAGFLRQQARVQARRDFTTTAPGAPTKLVPLRPTPAYFQLPPGMVEIPGATLELTTEMRVRECGFYDSTPPSGDVYNFQVRRFPRTVTFPRFALDETLVSNAQFAQFLKATRYRPPHKANFLKHWTQGRPPADLEDHPVVYVDLDDARAYANWAGKRLPTEEEWQYAAQGPDGRKYPWGEQMEPDRCNAGQRILHKDISRIEPLNPLIRPEGTLSASEGERDGVRGPSLEKRFVGKGGTTPVKAFLLGRSPFGCYDMCGNVWQWTESERSDGHTRFCIIRGGSYYTAKGSGWYVDGGPRPANFATKFLLTWPGLDRCSTIGFRCAADLGIATRNSI